MVYYMTETNLCLFKPETWGCLINKGSAAALLRCTSAIYLTVVRRTSATGQVVLAFMTIPFLDFKGRAFLGPENSRFGRSKES
jgi:hypothetical protein